MKTLFAAIALLGLFVVSAQAGHCDVSSTTCQRQTRARVVRSVTVKKQVLRRAPVRNLLRFTSRPFKFRGCSKSSCR